LRSFRLAAPAAHCEPSSAAAVTGHSPDDFFTPVCRARSGWLRPGRENWQSLPASLMGFGSLRSIAPVAPGVVGFVRPRTHLPFPPRTSRELWRSVFLSREQPLPLEGIQKGLAALGFWGLAPSTSRAMWITGPAIAFKRAAQSTGQSCLGIQLLFQVPRTRAANPRIRGAVACPFTGGRV